MDTWMCHIAIWKIAPIYIRRHYGSTDLVTICEEILGLSKMDFNNMDLYSKMPCTLNTAQKIAKCSVYGILN